MTWRWIRIYFESRVVVTHTVDGIANCVQKVSFAKASMSVDKQGIVVLSRTFGNVETGSKGELIARSADEVRECIVGV